MAAWPHARPYWQRSWHCCRTGSMHGSRTGPTLSPPAAPWHPHDEGPGGRVLGMGAPLGGHTAGTASSLGVPPVLGL